MKTSLSFLALCFFGAMSFNILAGTDPQNGSNEDSAGSATVPEIVSVQLHGDSDLSFGTLGNAILTTAERTKTFYYCVFSNVNAAVGTVFTNIDTSSDPTDAATTAGAGSNTLGNFDISIVTPPLILATGDAHADRRIGYAVTSALSTGAIATTVDEDTCKTYTLTLIMDDTDLQKAKQGLYEATITVTVSTTE